MAFGGMKNIKHENSGAFFGAHSQKQFEYSNNEFRSLRNDNKISRQYHLHFQILMSWRFPRKISFLDDFSSAPQAPPPPPKSANFILIVVSQSNNEFEDFSAFPFSTISALGTASHFYVAMQGVSCAIDGTFFDGSSGTSHAIHGDGVVCHAAACYFR